MTATNWREYDQAMAKKENIRKNNVDYSELVEYLDKRFTTVDKRFNSVDGRLIGVDKRFIAVDREFVSIHAEFADLKKDFRQLQTAVDAYAKKADTYFQEMVMLAHKVDRHEKWLQKLADKVGVKLDY